MTEGLLSPVPLSTRSPLFFFRPYMNSSVVIFFITSNSLYPQVCLSTYSTSFISARLVTCAVISVHSFGRRKKLASGLLNPSNVWTDRCCIEKREVLLSTLRSSKHRKIVLPSSVRGVRWVHPVRATGRTGVLLPFSFLCSNKFVNGFSDHSTHTSYSSLTAV